MRLVLLGLVLLAASPGGAWADDWKSGRVRDLVFDVPAAWHFVYDPKDGAGGYVPDARKASDAPLGVTVVPGRFSEVIPPDAIAAERRITVGGRAATEYEIETPPEIGIRGRMIDIDGASLDGRLIGLSLIAPVDGWAEWLPAFERVLASARFEPDLSTFVVPDLEGRWYIDGREEQPAWSTGQSLSAFFLVDPNVETTGDERLEVVRLAPLALRIVSGAPAMDGVIDAAGSRIEWDDGTVWTRAPAATEAAAVAEPQNAAGVSQAFDFGPLSTRVPAGWTISTSSRPPLDSAYAVDPAGEGLAAAATLVVPAEEAQAAFGTYVEQANAVLLQGGRPVSGAAAEAPWTMAARYEGVMVWSASNAQPTILEARAAETETGLVMLFVAWPSDAGAHAIDQARGVLAAASLAPGGAEAQPETVLFDGTLADPWQELSVAGGDFARFARIADGVLLVDVPAGNSWAKTGIWTPRPVVALHGRDGKAEVAQLRFTIDPAGTSSFVLALGARDTPDEWDSHDLRFTWSRSADGNSGSAFLFVRRGEVARLATGPQAPAYVDLSLDSDGFGTATLPDGRGMEGLVPDGAAESGYRVYALAHAPQHNAAASLALQRIALEQSAQEPRSDPSLYPDGRDSLVLFDGRLAPNWVQHSAAGGDFGRDAWLESRGLVVSVPEGNGAGKVGILSPNPLVWLDSFGKGSEVTVEFSIDPQMSDGFGLALAEPGWGGVGGNDPGAPNASFIWLRDGAGGHAEFHLHPHDSGDFWGQDGGATAPATVRFVLRPGEVTLLADGFEPVTRPWPVAADGAGLRVYAYAIAPAHNAATRFALKEIRLLRTGAAPASPEEGADLPPATVLFDGRAGAQWEEIGVAGGNFAAFARFEDGALRVSAPEGNGWAKTGLLSTEPAVVLDGRVHLAPIRLSFQFDPAVPQNVVVALSGNRVAEMWPDHVAWISLTHVADKDRYVLSMRFSPYHDWSREIDGAWMRQHWDGRLWIDVGHHWAAARIPGGPGIRGSSPISEGGAYFVNVVAHAPKEGAAASMALRRIERSFAPSSPLSEIDRLILVDMDSFDPDDFADALVGGE